MKRAILLTTFVLLCGVSLAKDVEIAVVDMNALLRAHPETEKAENALEDQIAEMEKERDLLRDKLEKMRDEVEEVMKQAQNRALSEKKREQLREQAEEKYRQLRQMDIDAKKQMDSRKKDVAEQKMMMHKRIVGQIAEIVSDYAKKKGYTFVLDSGGVGVSGMPAVIYAEESKDITEDIRKLVEKDKD